VGPLIHETGARADATVRSGQLRAIPSDLMESELFGHKRGSFTGAVADKPGWCRAPRAARCSWTKWPTCR